MENTDFNKYLSLKNAARLYGYTRDHLGLMIRRGKLRGLKLGSYYVTTAEWMIEYIKKYADPVHPSNKSKLSNKFLSEALSVNVKTFTEKPKTPLLNTTFSAPKLTNKLSQNVLQSEILKELSRFNATSSEKKADPSLKSRNYSLSESGNLPYIILPMRKMNDFERNEILNCSKWENDKIGTSEIA